MAYYSLGIEENVQGAGAGRGWGLGWGTCGRQDYAGEFLPHDEVGVDQDDRDREDLSGESIFLYRPSYNSPYKPPHNKRR